MHGHDEPGHAAGGHAHDHTTGANARMLGWALALTATYLVAEVIGAFLFNSLACYRTQGICSPMSRV